MINKIKEIYSDYYELHEGNNDTFIGYDFDKNEVVIEKWKEINKIQMKLNEIINHLNVQTDSQKAESNFKIIDDKNGFISINYNDSNKSLLDAASFNAQDYGLNVVQQAAINNMAKVLNALRDMFLVTMGAEWVELNSHTILETATTVVAFK